MPSRPKPVLIIMARWPRMGQGKTRLAAETSAATAVRVQRHSLDRLIHRLSQVPIIDLVIALANPADFRAARLSRRFHNLPLTSQCRGDLGYRMHRLLLQFGGRGRPILIIGSDLASVRPSDIATALNKLRHHDFVLGPASDGGFWLIGWRGGPAHRLAPLDGIRWSARTTRQDTIKRLSQSKGKVSRIGLIREASDIDDQMTLRTALKRRDLSRP